ncbi:hypothetical protein L0Y65_03970 [Candidatus Micrarchaeota archaeon]|nr:hypothetical protein [Candidatus Micrarchaeota archaeon]
MQTLEAALSLLVFASILPILLHASEDPRGIDDSLYRMQLANDAWRVLYLRGHFQGYGPGGREALERDMDEITRTTSLCLFLDGIRSTSCRGGDSHHPVTAAIRRTIIRGGIPEQVPFSLGN